MDTLELPVVEPASVTWYRIDERRYRWAPQDRPPAAARAFVGLLGVGSMLTAAALLLSDRAPGVVQTVFGDRARDLWQRIDATERVNLPAGSEIPPTDFVAHIAIWAVVTALIGLAIWTWRGLAIGIAALSGGSLLLELAQGRYASTRTVQAADARRQPDRRVARSRCRRHLLPHVVRRCGAHARAAAFARPAAPCANLNGPPRSSLR